MPPNQAPARIPFDGDSEPYDDEGRRDAERHALSIINRVFANQRHRDLSGLRRDQVVGLRLRTKSTRCVSSD